MIRPRLRWILLALAFSLGVTARGRAGDDAQRDDLKKAAQRLLNLQAEKAALQREMEFPVAAPNVPRDGTPKGTELGVPETLKTILGKLDEDEKQLLGKSRQERDDALKNLETRTNKEYEAVVRCWETTLGDSLQLLDDLAAEETRLQLSVASIGPRLRPDWTARRSWLEWDGPTARTLLWMWPIVTASLWLCGHLGRRERRSWWRGRGRLLQWMLGAALSVAAVSWLAVFGLTVAKLIEARLPPVGSAPAAGPREALHRALRIETERLNAEADKVELENIQLRQRADKQRETAFRGWTEALGVAPNSEPEIAERETAKKVREALVRIEETKLLADEATTAAKQLAQDRIDFAAAISTRQSQAVAWAWARLLFLGVLALLPLIPPLLLVRRQSRRRRRAARECPRCAATGKLETVLAPVRDERYPEPKFIQCLVCQHQFRYSHRRLFRLCFPTAGLVGSGKTHWLLETYAQIAEGRLPTRIQMTEAPSLGDQTFDDKVRDLRQNYKTPGATAATEGKFPYPITLHLQDLDSAPSRVLINLFDFGGEMTTRGIEVSVLRRRALMMDGFVFFLDPTRPAEEHGSQLRRFAQDIREMRGLPPEARLDVPVAVCLPKLDLLPTRTEFSGRAKPWLRKLRQTQGRAATLALLRQRSRLVREALLPLFPGWAVEKNLLVNFGHNFLFFPLTPVGLEERELETADWTPLRDRALDPFGVTEPVLWLLHMHGYRVLA